MRGAREPGSGLKRVVAFDLSLTAAGVAVWDSRRSPFSIQTHVVRGPTVKKGSAPHYYAQRLAKLEVELMQFVKARRAEGELVVFEDYAWGARQLAHQLGELGGVLRLAVFRVAVPFAVVNPATVKKFATGRGNCKKSDVLLAASRQLGYSGNSHNEADALWILQMALSWYLPHEAQCKLTKYREESLKKVSWPF